MKISVLTSAFNQEDYISQCVESVISQQGDFELEHVIIDDASSDRTPKILEELSQRHKHIKLILRSQNLNNLNHAWQYVIDADYIAFLDGDDFWSDNNKLTKQIQLLTLNPNVNLCGSRFSLLYKEKGLIEKVKYWKPREKLSFEDLILGNEMTMSTILIRRSFLQKLIEINMETPLYDSFLVFFSCISYNCIILNEYTTIKREHSANQWSKRTSEEKNNLRAKLFDNLKTLPLNDHLKKIMVSIQEMHKMQQARPDELSPKERLFKLNEIFPNHLNNNPKLLMWKTNLCLRVQDIEMANSYCNLIKLNHPQKEKALFQILLHSDPSKFVLKTKDYKPLSSNDKCISIIVKGLLKNRSYNELEDFICRLNPDGIEENIRLIYQSLFVILNNSNNLPIFEKIYNYSSMHFDFQKETILKIKKDLMMLALHDKTKAQSLLEELELEDELLKRHRNILLKKIES